MGDKTVMKVKTMTFCTAKVTSSCIQLTLQTLLYCKCWQCPVDIPLSCLTHRKRRHGSSEQICLVSCLATLSQCFSLQPQIGSHTLMVKRVDMELHWRGYTVSGPWPFKEQRHRCYETTRSGGFAHGRWTCHMQAPDIKNTPCAHGMQNTGLRVCASVQEGLWWLRQT